MKRPDDLTSMHPDAPYNSSHINSSSRDQEELDLLSESNHTHYLFDSFVSSELYKTVEKRIGRSVQNGSYSVWVDAVGQDTSIFSIAQFYHEWVSLREAMMFNSF